MEFKANNGIWGNMFGVPCVVADNLLKIATGTQIKVLLYILRCSGRDCTEEEIAVNTGVSLQEVADSVFFWQQANVLTPQQPNNAPPAVFQMTPPPVQQNTANETVPENPPEQKKAKREPQRRHWTGTEISRLQEESQDIKELLSAVQSILGSVNHMQTENIINMHEDLGMKKEVIMILIGYCKQINRTYPNYIYSIACQWANDNINTQEQADKEVQMLLQLHDYKHSVMRILNVERFTELQENMIKDWNNWHITMDMVKYAYETSLSPCENKLSINYINGIIKKWHEKGITDLQGAKEDSVLHKQNSTQKYSSKKDDDDFDVDMYSICINNFEVI